MRQSNLYIILYSAALTVVCGGLLALASEGLKDKQQANIEHEQKENILGTVMQLKEEDNVEQLYASRVKAFVIDFQGNLKEGVEPKNINIAAEYKKPAEQRLLPIYEFLSASDSNKVENVVIPVYGYGLWNNIWGFVALKSDLSTIQGVEFAHAGETPGLGARIATDEIQDRYKEKSIFEGDNIVSVLMMKGEGQDYAGNKHQVDGMSGATLTAKGVNNMLKDYFGCYESYLMKQRKN